MHNNSIKPMYVNYMVILFCNNKSDLIEMVCVIYITSVMKYFCVLIITDLFFQEGCGR